MDVFSKKQKDDDVLCLVVCMADDDYGTEVSEIDPSQPFLPQAERFLGQEVKIGYISKDASRQAVINGEIINGHSQANAERIADGLEPLESLED